MRHSCPASADSAIIVRMNGSERIPGFGQRVQEVLDAAGINRSQAMRRLGVAYTTLTKWVEGENVPNVANVIPLAELGGVHIEWLITGQGPKYVDPSRNGAESLEEAERRVTYRTAVEEYLASQLAEGVSAKVAGLLRDFDFSTLGIERPNLTQVHRVRDLMDMQETIAHLSRDGRPPTR